MEVDPAKEAELLRPEELRARHCWEGDDALPKRPAMSDFRRRLRAHQCAWRERHGHPAGSQPILPQPGRAARLVGSRLPLEYARTTGANFLTAAALAAVRGRTSSPEPHQSFDHQRLWADLLWAPALAFNLFGDLAEDSDAADRAVRSWWPEAPGRVSEVRFAHSPGRLDRAYLNSLRAFDAAFILDRGGAGRGIVGVSLHYHDWAKPEIPRPENRWRYDEVAARSGAFAAGAIEVLGRRSPLCVMWLEHLLLLSMLQHESSEWTWGRYVVLHPSGNVDIAEACAAYRGLLADPSTFRSLTLETLLDAGALSREADRAVRERYLLG